MLWVLIAETLQMGAHGMFFHGEIEKKLYQIIFWLKKGTLSGAMDTQYLYD